MALLALLGPQGTRAEPARELRVFISADTEGITGVVNTAQLGPGALDYERFRKLMTAEVNATIEGALAAGATRVTASRGS